MDKERQKIGQNLHDGLGQILTGSGYLCELLIKKLTEKSIPEASLACEIYKLIKESKNKTRILARGLCPINIGAEWD